MKRAWFIVFAIFTLFLGVFVAKARANEGRFTLTNGSVVCEGLSVWEDSSYRVTGRCDGLVYPFSAKLDHYTIWVRQTGDTGATRLDDISRGVFEGRVENDFNQVLVTAEEDSSPRRPGDNIVVSGNVDTSLFVREAAPDATQATPMPMVSPTPSPSPSPTGGIGSIIGRIFTALLIIFLTIVGLVIVGSLIFRRRGSVSGQ